MDEIKIFENAEFGQIRTMVIDKQPWFVGKDVATLLGYANIADAVKKHVDDEDKGIAKCDTLGGIQNLIVINESGLFALILSSKLPSAKRFKHWVTSEVLPQIRQTGGYIPVSDDDDDQTIMAKAAAIVQRTVHCIREKLSYCDNVLQSPSCYTMTQIAKDLSMTVMELEHRLHAQGIIYRSQNGPFMLYAKHLGKGYEAYRTSHGKEGTDGFEWTGSYLVWTEKGREFVHRSLTPHA